MKKRADYEVGNLEGRVELQANDAIKSIENLINSVNNLTSALNNSINSTKSNKLKDNVDKSVSSVKSLKKVMNFGAMYVGLRKVWNVASNISSSYIDMIETNNLFEVSMGKVIDQYGNLDEEASKYYTKALAFQDKMNEKLATNKSELMKYQAMYYSMFKSQGIDKDSSYLMSESLTKAGYDIASLYNLTVDDAMDKLKSGIAGQVEPLRKIGVDISESALTKVIRDAGITDRSVQQLSYAEKEVARYIAILNQAGQAQGDFANTFEQPANQIKVFKNQLEELKQVAGSFIMNTFGGIIVYANAIIMALKEIIKSFATLFGYDLTTGGGNLSGYTEDVSDNLGSAVGKAKELKKQLMGFDEINNITPQNNSGSGSGTAFGIDDKLLKSLKEWDNKMESISGKAQEIRDKMLGWLGFERNDDGTWRLGEGYTNFEKIKDVAILIGSIIVGWKLSSFISSLVTSIAKAKSLKIALSGIKTKLGLGLAIASIYFITDGIKGIQDGEITGEDLIKSLGGAIGLGVGVGMLTGSVPLALILSIGTIGFVLTEIGKQGMLYKTWEVIDNALSFAGFKVNKSSKETLELEISMISLAVEAFKFVGLGELLEKSIDNLMLEVAKYAKNIPIIGEAISYAITMGVKAKEDTVTNTVKYSTQEALEDANPWIKESAKLSGIEMRKSQTEGYTSKITETTKSLSTSSIQALRDASKEINEYAKETGQSEAKSIDSGIASETLSDGTNKLINTSRAVLDTTTLFPEGQKVGETIKDGYSKNSIENETTDMIENARTTIKKSSLSAEAQDLSKSINTGFNSTSTSWWTTVQSWFSVKKWKELAQNVVVGIQSVFGGYNFKIKLPHFTWTSTPATGWISNVLSALNLPTSLPKLNVSWYASGGMPDVGEMFIARESGPEMVGKIGNKTTVANNDQIVTAIKQGVYEAVSSAMANGGNEVHLDIRADEGVIVKKASQGFKDYVMQTGELPFPVPV